MQAFLTFLSDIVFDGMMQGTGKSLRQFFYKFWVAGKVGIDKKDHKPNWTYGQFTVDVIIGTVVWVSLIYIALLLV